MGALTRFVLGHKWLVAASWLLVTIIAVMSTTSAIGALSQDSSIPGEGAETSQDILQTYGNGGQVSPLVPVVSLPEGTTVESRSVREELAALFTAIEAAAPNARVVSFASTGDRAFVSEDGRTTFGLVFVPLGEGFAEAPEAAAVRQALAGATIAGAPVSLTGYSELEAGSSGGEEGGPLVETLVAAGGALVVLGWVFGSFLALVPLLVAAIAILATLLAIWGVTTVANVSTIVEFIVPLIGLGVAIDYALLIVTRWREERDAGLDNGAAVQRAMETAGSAVVFSGITVGVSLLALIVLPVPFVRSIGYAGMLIPLISVLVAITLLPVILSTVGPRLDWPRLRRDSQESRAWAAWARLVVRGRWVATGAALVMLAALVIPALSLSIGDPRADSLATSGEAYDGLVTLEESGIGSGVLLPFEVLTKQSDPNVVVSALRACGRRWRRLAMHGAGGTARSSSRSRRRMGTRRAVVRRSTGSERRRMTFPARSRWADWRR